MQGCGADLYALGNTKILAMPEIRDVLEEAKKRASIKRDQAAEIIKKAFLLFGGVEDHKKRLNRMQCV